MRPLKFKCVAVSVFFLLGISLTFADGKTEYTKRVKREFPISMEGQVELLNKYGNVNIKASNNPNVLIDILVTVDAKSEARANEIFERITFQFSNSDDYVKAATKIDTEKKGLWNWTESKAEFKIDYNVSMPQTCALNLINKYGDAFVPVMDADVVMDIKYGNFRLEGTGGMANITLGYGNGTVLQSSVVKGDIKYSKFRVKQCEELDIITKYSKVTLEELEDAKINSKYDTYVIGRVQELFCEGKYDNYSVDFVESISAYAKYSDYNIDDLRSEADMHLEYGDVRIDNVSSTFSQINLDGRYTSFKLDVEPGTNYQLEAYGEYAGVKYPEDLNVSYEKEKGSYHEVKGGTGSAGRVIKANLKYGGLKIY